MEPLLVAALAFALGLLVGAGVFAVYLVRANRTRRAVYGASAALATVLPSAPPERSAADIWAGIVRVVLGGVPYDLPVLPRRASAEWIASLDARFANVASALDQADTPEILVLLTGHTSAMLEMLRLYDVNGVLPDAEYVDRYATDAEILRATVEVWRAANPLAAVLTEATQSATVGISSEPPSTSPTPTAGPSETSTS